jgi:DNA gyrase/topoisomerase IV subunit B
MLLFFSFLGGRNGYGAKVTNIFSKKFTIETCSKEFKKLFKQVFDLFKRNFFLSEINFL